MPEDFIAKRTAIESQIVEGPSLSVSAVRVTNAAWSEFPDGQAVANADWTLAMSVRLLEKIEGGIVLALGRLPSGNGKKKELAICSSSDASKLYVNILTKDGSTTTTTLKGELNGLGDVSAGYNTLVISYDQPDSGNAGVLTCYWNGEKKGEFKTDDCTFALASSPAGIQFNKLVTMGSGTWSGVDYVQPTSGAGYAFHDLRFYPGCFSQDDAKAYAALVSVPEFTATYRWRGGASGSFADPANWEPSPSGAFTVHDELVVPSAADINLDAAASAGRITVSSDGPVSFSGGGKLTVSEISNNGSGKVTFACGVEFTGTYAVLQNGEVEFSGGATATYPCNGLRTQNSTENTRTLRGRFTFTEDWIVGRELSDDCPWVVANGTTVSGQNFSGLQKHHYRILRVDEGGYACFETVTNGWDRGDIDIDGLLEAKKEIIVRTNPSGGSTSSNFGRSGNIGTVKAPRIAKIEHSSVASYIPNLTVGAGGFGCITEDYGWNLLVATTITAMDSFDFLGVFRSDYPQDWGVHFSDGRHLTINVPEGKTVTCGIGIRYDGTIRKTGAGTLVMTDTFAGQSGFKKEYASGTVIDEGVVRLLAAGQLGTGPVLIASGARLEVAEGVSVSNQIDGDGTLFLAGGNELSMGLDTWCVRKVEIADGAKISVANSTSAGRFAFLTGIDASDAASFSFGDTPLALVGDTLIVSTSTDTAGAYVWNGDSGADWSVAANWLVDGAVPAKAPSSSDSVVFNNTTPVTVGGDEPLSVTKIVTLSDDLVTFACPVKFAGTYLVENAAAAPRFEGGATATYADASLTDMNVPSHALNGSITFTEDWKVPLQPVPFVVTADSTLTGKGDLAAEKYSASQPELRIDEGAVAAFNTISTGGTLLFWLNGGNLVATGDITLSKNEFGYNKGNTGTVEANGIYKSVTGSGHSYLYTTNLIVGAGGFGMYRKDYSVQLRVNTRLTAKADLTIHQPIAGDGPKDGDWGLNLSGYTFTVDTAGHTVTFDSYTHASGGMIVKEGEGEMIMQSRQKRHTGGTVLNGGLTTVKLPAALGYGTATVNEGATLRFTDSVTSFEYPIVVNADGVFENAAAVIHSSTLTLNAGAVLRPCQNAYLDLSRGTLALPADGTVTIDMRGFTIANGVANPLIVGVADGDEAKFSALVPDGVSGSFSVSGGILSYTATAGGSATAELFWHPDGIPTWSASVAAWTNAAGEQVAFVPFANVTFAGEAEISVPADVVANNVTVEADGDVTLNGEGGLGGSGMIVKKGEGTFTFNAQGGLDAQTLVVSNGVFKVGDDLSGSALGAAADTSPIIVADGGTLDLNYNSTTESNVERSKVTRDKLVHIAGDGHEGQGALVNSNKKSYQTLSDVVLDDDASVGGSQRFDVRGGIAGYARNNASIYGPGKKLTVKNTSTFGIVNATTTLDSIIVTNGGVMQIEGSSSTWNIPNGIRLHDGKLIAWGGSSEQFPANLSVVAESGTNQIYNGSGTTTFNGPVTVAPGATLTQTGGNILYKGAVSGNFNISGGNMYFDGGVPENGLSVDGAMGSERIYLRQSGTFAGAELKGGSICVADKVGSTVDVVFTNSTIDTCNLFLSWGGVANSSCSIGPDTMVKAAKIAIGDTGTTNANFRSVLSVDGGTVSLTGVTFYVAYDGPHSDFIVNSGVVDIDQAPIRLRGHNAYLGGGNTARFIQNGGEVNYGGSGFLANYEDNTDGGQIVLKGGEFNAFSDWSIPYFIPVCFKDGDADGWTLNQEDGKTATWNTALFGDGDVTLNGAATLVGNKEVQGAVGGKWTVGDGFTAGLEGAASLLGGLDVGEGASVSVNIATNRSAVFTARDFSDNPGKDGCITNRFNRAIGGTTRGTITHDMTFFFKLYQQADRPFGNMSYSSAYAVGEFYVEDAAAGDWSFTANCDDWAMFWIDGEQVISTEQCKAGTGTRNLSAGWHTFRHIILDNSGAYGNAQTIGYKYGAMSGYANFSTKNLKMRPAADFGDPGNANTVRWSHYKGTANDVKASTYKNDDFAWDFCCITNSLQKLQWYGKGEDAYINGYTVNRYDGWFYVTAENADKVWTFRSSYDDQGAMWIDGVDTGLTGASGNSLTYAVTLARGWHRFRIQTADYTGSAGPWSGMGNAFSYQVGNGAQTVFNEETLALTVCPDGYIQGGVTLASNATLSNNATENAAVVHGDVTATGTGAKMRGAFRFDGGALAFRNVAVDTRDLSSVLAFDNPAADFLADVGAITVDFAGKPATVRVAVCPAGGLTEAEAQDRISVTQNGEPVKNAVCRIKDGNIVLNMHVGFSFVIR